MRFGVIGTSWWAGEIHAAGVAGHPEAVLAGVWGRDPARTQALADRYDVDPYADLDALFDAVDAVTFSVSPQVQAELAVRAAAAGKHLLLEKPLAIGLPAAEQVVQAVDAAGVAALVFFNDRYLPEPEDFLTSMTGAVGGRAEWLACLQTPDNPFAHSPWRHAQGALWDVGPHALAALLPVLGPVRDVTGARGPGDLVHLVLTHNSGAVSTAALSLTMPEHATRVVLEFTREDGFHRRPDRGRGALDAHRNAVADLITLARTGHRDHRCNVHFARDVVAILDKAAHHLDP